jgi:hypothetical protein
MLLLSHVVADDGVYDQSEDSATQTKTHPAAHLRRQRQFLEIYSFEPAIGFHGGK